MASDALDPSPEGVFEIVAADAVWISLRQHQAEEEIPALPPAGFQSGEGGGAAAADDEGGAGRIGHEPGPLAPLHLPDEGTGSDRGEGQRKAEEAGQQREEEYGVGSESKEKGRRAPPVIEGVGRVPPAPSVVVVVVVTAAVVVAAATAAVVQRRMRG